jgi:hypothetical protein
LSKPLSIDSGVLQRLRNLPRNERVECLLSLCELTEIFGRPHLYSGLGIRKLGERLFEYCFIFQNRPTDLLVYSWGTTTR